MVFEPFEESQKRTAHKETARKREPEEDSHNKTATVEQDCQSSTTKVGLPFSTLIFAK
jgi:hypothetical protein